MKTTIILTLLCLFFACVAEGSGQPAKTQNANSSKQGASGDHHLGVSSNPGVVNIETGTGKLGELLGIKKDSGVRLGGLWIGDVNYLIAGGLNPRTWSSNSLFQLALSFDTQKLNLWKGGLFNVEFLQFNGSQTNLDSGAVQSYNGLPGPPPLNRSELYQLWYRHELFDKKLVIRIGKVIPTYDFNNVLRPIPLSDDSLIIPATSGLIYTPIFVISTLLGEIPGYYNSAYGITATFAPVESFYFSYGIYDGNFARGVPTGLRGPEFNGYYFQIAEAGVSWGFDKKTLPGKIAVGAWTQSGRLTSFFNDVSAKGAQGFYLFGSQRLWRQHPGVDNSGLIGFFQAGSNHSKTLPINQYFGAGLTFLGLVPRRKDDSFGMGLAYARLNRRVFEQNDELLLQGYYQLYLFGSNYFLVAFSYIPNPGAVTNLKSASAVTARLITSF